MAPGRKGIYMKARTKNSEARPKILFFQGQSRNRPSLSPGLQASQKYIHLWQAGRGLRVYPPQAWHSVSQEEGDGENKQHSYFCSVCRRLMGDAPAHRHTSTETCPPCKWTNLSQWQTDKSLTGKIFVYRLLTLLQIETQNQVKNIEIVWAGINWNTQC